MPDTVISENDRKMSQLRRFLTFIKKLDTEHTHSVLQPSVDMLNIDRWTFNKKAFLFGKKEREEKEKEEKEEEEEEEEEEKKSYSTLSKIYLELTGQPMSEKVRRTFNAMDRSIDHEPVMSPKERDEVLVELTKCVDDSVDVMVKHAISKARKVAGNLSRCQVPGDAQNGDKYNLLFVEGGGVEVIDLTGDDSDTEEDTPTANVGSTGPNVKDEYPLVPEHEELLTAMRGFMEEHMHFKFDPKFDVADISTLPRDIMRPAAIYSTATLFRSRIKTQMEDLCRHFTNTKHRSIEEQVGMIRKTAMDFRRGLSYVDDTWLCLDEYMQMIWDTPPVNDEDLEQPINREDRLDEEEMLDEIKWERDNGEPLLLQTPFYEKTDQKLPPLRVMLEVTEAYRQASAMDHTLPMQHPWDGVWPPTRSTVMAIESILPSRKGIQRPNSKSNPDHNINI
jgi:hypothetical protein